MNGNKRPSAKRGQGKTATGENGTEERTFSASDSNTNRESAQVYRDDGRMVGGIVNDVFRKHVDASKHFLRNPPAIAFDLNTLGQAKENGARFIEVIDRESGQTYRTTIAHIWEKGFTFDRGSGRQIGLVLSEWNKCSADIAHQLTLF